MGQPRTQHTTRGGVYAQPAAGGGAYAQPAAGGGAYAQPAAGGGVYGQRGLFVCLEGGEGSGKSTQQRLLVEWLQQQGYQVTATFEPGDTAVGREVRRILLDPATGRLADRTEALLYAADKAEHVETVVAPALATGGVVVCDRYVDSTLAYQGAGRSLPVQEVERVARWATGDLRPHLTVLLDLDPEYGLRRGGGEDRIEQESLAFHRRVREAFLGMAAEDPEHSLVVDATLPPEEVAARLRERLGPLLPAEPGAVGTAPESREGVR